MARSPELSFFTEKTEERKFQNLMLFGVCKGSNQNINFYFFSTYEQTAYVKIKFHVNWESTSI